MRIVPSLATYRKSRERSSLRWATRITGQTITPSVSSFAGERYTAFTLREPIGVVVGIVPRNFSSMIAT